MELRSTGHTLHLVPSSSTKSLTAIDQSPSSRCSSPGGRHSRRWQRLLAAPPPPRPLLLRKSYAKFEARWSPVSVASKTRPDTGLVWPHGQEETSAKSRRIRGLRHG